MMKCLWRAAPFAFLLLLALTTPSLASGQSDAGIDREEFRAPIVDIAPFWFWNGDMQPEEMERQLRAMKDAGIHSVVFHPRSGLGGQFDQGELEYYLSQTYFERFKFALETCRRLGLKVVLYDEYNWPSGQGGGRVLDGGPVGTGQVPPNPEYIAKNLAMVEIPVGADGTQGGVWQIPDGKLIGIIAAQAHQNGLVRSTFVNLTSKASQGSLSWRFPNGSWRLMFFMQQDSPPGGPGTAGKTPGCCPDLMNPAAIDKFISVTHAEYYRRFPEYFGSTIIGIFTDEPGFLNNRIDGVFPNTVPWTEALPAYFEREKGYSLIDSLPLLWVGDSEENAKIRTDFWDALSTLYMDTYYRKIQDWCKAHRIEAVGHVLEDALRFHRTFEGGDYFKTMRYMNRGGADQIGNRHFGLINAKLASSASRMFGFPHSLMETFGAYGWGLTPEEMKAVIDYHATSGIDTEVLHALFYSIDGPRKQDSPPDLFYHQIWKDQFHTFVADASRMLYLSGRGRQVSDIAIFYPTTAIMTEGGLMNFVPLAKMEEYFLSTSDAIRAIQDDFNYVDELVLAGDQDLHVPVSLSANALNVNGMTYGVVVLPAVPSISGAAAKLLERFYESGGKMIAVGTLPVRATDGQTALVRSFLTSVFDTTEASPAQSISRTNKSGGRAIFIPVTNMVSDAELAKLPIMVLATAPTSVHRGKDLDYSQPWLQQFIQAIRETARSDVQTPAFHPQIAVLHKRGGGKEWYLINNDSAETVSDDFTFASSDAPSIWDPESGNVRQAPAFREESGHTTIPLKLEPYSALAVVFEKATEEVPHLTSSSVEVLESQGTKDRLGLRLLSEAEGPISVSAIYRGRKMTRSLEQTDKLGSLPLTGPWPFQRQGGDEPAVSRELGSWVDEWPTFSGTGWYEKDVVVDGLWVGTGRRVFLDLGDVRNIAEVRVNGKSAGTQLWPPYRFDITELLKAGSNRLQIGVTNTLANRYGQGRPGLTEKPASGLLGPVRLVSAKILTTEFIFH